MTRLTSEQGVSLMILILAITVFAGVAIGVVTLLRARHESYPYQVQSYQAYALANAGVEFATRYVRDNTDSTGNYVAFLTGPNGFPSTNPGRKFTLPNGSSFWLRYDRGTGCSDKLFSLGKYGTATREIEVSNFGAIVSSTGSSPLKICSAVTMSDYGPDLSGYSGRRIEFDVCDCTGLLYGITNYNCVLNATDQGNITTIAATLDKDGKQVVLGRLGFSPAGVSPTGSGARSIWDATCPPPSPPNPVPSYQCALCNTAGTPTCNSTAVVAGLTVYPGQTLPSWDNLNHPTPLSGESLVIHPVFGDCCGGGNGMWAVQNSDYTGANRPQIACDPNPATCGHPTPPGCEPNPSICSHPENCRRGCPCCTGPAVPCCDTSPQCFDLAPAGVFAASRTAATCATWEPSQVNSCGTCSLSLDKGLGHLVIETFGKVKPPVTFYLELPYSQYTFYDCVHSGFCREWGPWHPVSLTFTAK